jgi:putative endonuclease
MPSSRGNSDRKINRTRRGRTFETLAADFYVGQGFVVLERNWRAGHKEIDLIVRKDRQVVFVEVKASFSKEFGHPAERIDKKKIQNLIDAANRYIAEHGLAGVDLRFDAVTFDNGKLEHYPDAFAAS